MNTQIGQLKGTVIHVYNIHRKSFDMIQKTEGLFPAFSRYMIIGILHKEHFTLIERSKRFSKVIFVITGDYDCLCGFEKILNPIELFVKTPGFYWMGSEIISFSHYTGTGIQKQPEILALDKGGH